MTTPIDPFERRLPEALTQLARPQTPDYLADVLALTATRRQRARWMTARRGSRSLVRLGRPAMIAAVALVIVSLAGVVIVATRPKPGPDPRPALISGDLVPAPLLESWTGVPRQVATVDRFTRVLTLTASDVYMLDDTGASYVSRAVIDAGGRLAFQSSAIDAWCQDGTIGRYDWTASDGGHALTLSTSDDACASRRTALTGSWTMRPDEAAPCVHCRGALEAGTHRSVSFVPFPETYVPPSDFGHVTYTVPSGWVNSIDSSVAFGLEVDRTDGILLLAHPVAFDDVACTFIDPPARDATASSLMASIVASPRVEASTPEPINLGGMQGTWADLRPGAVPSPACADQTDPPILLSSNGPGTASLPASDRWTRLILLDGPAGGVVAIAIFSMDPARADQIVATAMPFVEAMVIN